MAESSTWTDERITELKRLWDAGLTASAIGQRLGVSKNAVVGKAHRLKLAARPSPIKRTASPRPRKKLPPAKPRVEKVVAPPRRHTGGPACLWPFGDPGTPEFHFCGAPAIPGKPYCGEHCAVAYISRNRSDTEAA